MTIKELLELIKRVNEILAERHPDLNICVGDRDTYGWKIHMTTSEAPLNSKRGWTVEISNTVETPPQGSKRKPKPWEVKQYNWMQVWGGYGYLAEEAVEIYSSLSA